MKLVDTHCHLDFGAYDEDRERVIQNAIDAGVTRIINPGTDFASSQRAINLAHQHDEIFAAVGVHPNSTVGWSPEVLSGIETLAANEKVVSIGEIGLDYYRDKSPKVTQHHAFETQLELAAKLELPIIIHNRDASEDVIAILREWIPTLPDSLTDRPGVLHSFSASWTIAEKALEMGFYLGFTGPVTFKKADDLRVIATRVPIDRILVETDGPFLTPHPYRGKRNQPAYVAYVADRIAALHLMDTETFAAQTTDNAERLFGLSV
ncbi:MAG: TatD family hydrolase [Chloroflexi bacterium]|nr:TatD family hydrolase [Chloroflexota bacterium]